MFLKRIGLACAGLLIATAAYAAVNTRQTADGGMCLNLLGGVTNLDAWCMTPMGGGQGAGGYIMRADNVHSFPRENVEIWDDFLYQTLTEADTTWILNKGSDAQATDPVIEAAQEGGGITLTSGNNSGTTSDDGTQLVGSIPMQAEQGGLVFEARLHIDTAVTTGQICAGFTDVTTLELAASISGTTITTNFSDGVVLCYDTAATTDQWYCIGVDGDTDATGNAITGVAPVADTFQTLRIEIDTSGATARCYINGSLVGALSAAAASPDVSLYPTVVGDATTTASIVYDVDYVYAGVPR